MSAAAVAPRGFGESDDEDGPPRRPGRQPLRSGCNTPVSRVLTVAGWYLIYFQGKKPRRTIGGVDVQGDSDDESAVAARVRLPCIPCVRACFSRGRIDCKPGKGRSCAACTASKRTCDMAAALYANHPGLRRAVRQFMDYANDLNSEHYVKKGKGKKAKDYGDEVRFRSGSGRVAHLG